MVPVTLVQEDVLAHAIWTVAFVFLLVVTDDRRHIDRNRNKLRLGL